MRRTVPLRINAVQQFAAGTDDHLGSGGRRRGAKVGYKIGDRDIRLVADRRNHRNGALGNGAGDVLFIKGPEVFERTSTPGQNNQLGPVVRPEVRQPPTDIIDRAQTLHPGREESDVDPWEPSRQNLHEIPNHRAFRRCHDSDPLRIAW